jgi:thioredoxin 1
VIERLVILVACAGVLVLAIVAARLYSRARRRQLEHVAGSVLLERLGAPPDGRPTLVTFSTPSCAACHTAQAPAVILVEQQLGPAQLRVVRIDAARQPEVAQTFGIMTVPSTVVLDPTGRVAAVNHGFAPTQQLVRQLQTS